MALTDYGALMDTQREADLVAVAKTGNLAAFLELVRAYQRPVYRLAYAITSDPTDASTLAAETFAQAWLGLHDLPERQRLFPWVLHMTRELSATLPRKHCGAVPENAESAEHDGRERLLAAFLRLQAPEKAALTLRVLERARYEDIAAWLGVPVAIAALRVSQARGLLLTDRATSKGDGVFHIGLELLSSYFDGEILESTAELVRRHVAACGECRLRLSALEEQEAAISQALTHDPGVDFFERLPERVERLVAPGGAEVARAVPAEPQAALPTREIGSHAGGPRAVRHRGRSSDRRAQPATQWLAVAVLVVLVGAAGIMVAPRAPGDRANLEPQPPPPQPPPAGQASGADQSSNLSVPISNPGPAPSTPTHHEAGAPERPVGSLRARETEPKEHVTASPSKNLLPVRRIITVTETTAVRPLETMTSAPRGQLTEAPRGQLTTPQAEPRAFATAPAAAQPSILKAQDAAQRATLDPTAANFDAAADEWERTVSMLAGTADQMLARQRLAETRLHAWEVEPTAYRAASATAALRLYIVFAPDGVDRMAARAALARLTH